MVLLNHSYLIGVRLIRGSYYLGVNYTRDLDQAQKGEISDIHELYKASGTARLIRGSLGSMKGEEFLERIQPFVD